MPDNILSHLEPKIVWSIFEAITQIPHPSKREEKLRQWIKNWATEQNLPVIKEDEVGNILLAAEASPGCESFPTLVLQAHMDMVCQKQPGVEIDFEHDPLKIAIDGDKVHALGTTLGADNGIGLAYCLAALIDPSVKRGPLEVLLTVDEETGLTGAFHIKKGFFSGKYLLNVDSEEVGKITISSAGGGGTEIVFPISLKEEEKSAALKLTITGLQGGHSGVDIDKARLNAIKLGVSALNTLPEEFFLATINGGSAHNAIPRDFTCEFIFAQEKENEISKYLTQWKKETLQVTKEIEPAIQIELTKSEAKKGIPSETTAAILSVLEEITHGPISFSKEIPGLVQTSSNLAMVRTTEQEVRIHISTRSSDINELENVREELKNLGEKYHAKVQLDKAYPGWKPQPEATFVQLVKRAYEEVLEKPVALEAIHAGLECGLFAALDPELEIASIGPNIANAHSPDEYVEIESVKVIWEVIKRLFLKIGEKK